MSQVPKPSSIGPRTAGVPSSALQRAGPPPLLPQPPRSSLVRPSVGGTGSLQKTANSGSIHFTEDTENFMVGDRVWVSGTKGGIIQFIGETKFAAGEWAGVVVDETGSGKNDGSVAGVQYFQCAANRGVFVRLHKLSRVPLSKEEIDAVKMQTMSAATSVGSISHAVENEFKLPGSGIIEANKGGGNTPEIGGLKLGQTVWLSGDRTGIIRFIGKPHFKEGIWAGIELDEPNGKNDGSVDNQRYFQCEPNHGVFAPIGKVSKAPLPSSSDEPRTPNRVMNLKRSPSQESMHSNFSVQSTTSRRSSAIRLGTSSLSPSTITVGRTGTGTPADIQRAHQEKDTLIANLTRERDLARKELAAKSNQERDVHSEIQKLQEQYVGALSAQDTRIQEMTDSLKLITEEKDKLREALDDEKKKMEDLQFQLEEELTAKEPDSQTDNSQKILEEKNKEIITLRNDAEAVRVELSRLQSSLVAKEEEVEKWRQAADGSNFQNSEIADDRDRIAFEVADLNRQLRDATEKHKLELSVLHNTLQEKMAADDTLRKELETQRDEIMKLRQEKEQLSLSATEASNTADTASHLQQENEDNKIRLSQANELLSKAKNDLQCTQSQYDNLHSSLDKKRVAMLSLFQQFADFPGPQSLDEEIPALTQLLATVQLRASKNVEDITAQLLDAQRSREEAETRNTKLLLVVADQNAELEGKTKSLDAATVESAVLLGETENLGRRVAELQGSLETATVMVEASHSEATTSSSLQKELEDKSRENESLLHQLSELRIEFNEVSSKQQELIERSQSDVTDAVSRHQAELAQLTQVHQSELEAIRSKLESQGSSLESRLHHLAVELEQANVEKLNLNQDIGKFIEVLRAKDLELKDVRQHIEDTFTEKQVENAELSSRLADQQGKLALLENEAKSLTEAYAERTVEFEALNEGLAEKERELNGFKMRADEAGDGCQALQRELEQSKSAFAEQMVLVEVRREDQLRHLSSERDILSGTVTDLEHRIAVLSANTAVEVDTLRDQLSARLSEANAQLTVRSNELDATQEQLTDVRNQLEKSNEDMANVLTKVHHLEGRLQSVLQDRDNLASEKTIVDEQVSLLKQSNQNLMGEVEDFRRLAEDTGRSASGWQAKLDESQRLLISTKEDWEESKMAFAEQMTLAQMRLEDSRKTAESEQSTLKCKIEALECQLAALLIDSASKIDAVQSDLQQRLAAAQAESQSKSSSLLSLQTELTSIQEKAQINESTNQINESTNRNNLASLKRAEDEVGRLSAQLEILEEKNQAAEKNIERLSGFPEKFAEIENQLAIRTSDLVAAQAHMAVMETRHSDSIRGSATLLEELESARRRVVALQAESLALRHSNEKVEGEKGQVTEELAAVKRGLDAAAIHSDALRNDLEKKSAELISQQILRANLEKELDQLRRNHSTLLEEKNKIQLEDRGTLDALLGKELERVKSEVDFHRRQIEQKDTEISRMTQQNRLILEEKNLEISAMRTEAVQSDAAVKEQKITPVFTSTASVAVSAGDKNEFQIQILNSIIADQQNKILDLEKKLAQSAPDKSKEPSETKLPPVRRPIRLYCATCEQFDLHDSLVCPKLQASSPERERKPKISAPKPRRKYCNECEMFDQHETTDCPVLLKKNPPRAALKATGLIRKDSETF